MRLIPVIDIKRGIAVHARRGERDHYAPLVTRFASSPAPSAVAAGMVAALGITEIYIADLDAITANGDNASLIADLARQLPCTRLLVDGGFGERTTAYENYVASDNIDAVIATESLATLDAYSALVAQVPRDRLLLSLDRKGTQCLGCTALFDSPRHWPERVIHMNLERVGAERGPDFAGLQALLERAEGRAVYAAGGVRDDADLRRLAAMGIDAVLIGTALHDGRLAATTTTAAKI